MNRFFTSLKSLLPLLAVLTAPVLTAAHEYMLYNLTKREAEPVVPQGDPAVWLRSDRNRGIPQPPDNAVYMLFVRDTALDRPGYIGVYEVLQTQAEALGWSRDFSKEVEKQAVYTLDFTGVNPVADDNGQIRNQSLEGIPGLKFPTPEDWMAYVSLPGDGAGEALKPANMQDGTGGLDFLRPEPRLWWSWQQQNSYAPAFPHGPVDMLGNVAEYVGDDRYYYGGASSGLPTFGSVTAKNIVKTKEALFGSTTGRGLLGARLMYFPPAEQQYTVTVMLNNLIASETSHKAGETVTVRAPDLPPQHRFSEWPQAHTDPTAPTFAYVMEAAPVTFAYTSKKYATLEVTGGTASETRPFLGSRVTLTAPPETDYGPFRTWVIDGREVPGSAAETFYTVPTYDSILPEVPIRITASPRYSRHPRVMVFGGRAEVLPDEAKPGKAFGDGFYRTGTVLKLTPDTLPGFTFDCWETSPASEDAVPGTYTVGAPGTSVCLTARFKPEENGSDTPAALPSVIGAEDILAPQKTAAVRFGYTFSAADNVRTVTDGAHNTFTFYEARLFGGAAPTDAYARLAFGSNAITTDRDRITLPEVPSSLRYLTGTVKDGKNTAFTDADKSSSLLMKRVNWNGGSSAVVCYYLGVNELTVAQAEKLAERAGAKKTDLNFDNRTAQVTAYRNGINLTDAQHRSEPFVFAHHTYGGTPGRSSLEDLGRLLAYLNGATLGGRHGMTFVLPRSTMIKEAVSAGAGADTAITADMVVSDVQRGPRDGWWLYAKSASKQCDPSGFYDLWGNVSETLDNGSARILAGGSAISSFAWCNLNRMAEYPDRSTDCGAFRPAVAVPAQCTVSVVTFDGMLTSRVFPGQTLLLAPQRRSEQRFLGWTASTPGNAPIPSADGTYFTYTVTGDVTLTPEFSKISVISVRYDGCLGTDAAYPDQTLPVYLPDGEARELIGLDITPAEAVAAADPVTRTFRLRPTDATVTVRAVYKDLPPPPKKPGFRLILR